MSEVNMRKDYKLLKDVLIDLVGLYYNDLLNDRAKYNAIKIYEELLTEGINLEDFTIVIKMMTLDLGQVAI
jgi:hypothetical protein